MSSFKKILDFKTASQMLNDDINCFELVQHRRHLALSPKHLAKFRPGIKEQLDTEIGLYSEKLNGVMIAYKSVHCVQKLGYIITSQPFIHFDVDVDVIVFKPMIGKHLRATVNKVSGVHIGCLVHGMFNASLPKHGLNMALVSKLTVGHKLEFLVTKIYMQNGLLSLRGELVKESINYLSTLPVQSKKRKASDMESSCFMSSGEEMNETLSQKPKKIRKVVASDECDNSTDSLTPIRKSHRDVLQHSTPLVGGQTLPSISQSPVPNCGQSDIKPVVEKDSLVADSLNTSDSTKKKKKKKKKEQDADVNDLIVNNTVSSHLESEDSYVTKSAKKKKKRNLSDCFSDMQPPGELQNLLKDTEIKTNIAENQSDISEDSGIQIKKKHKSKKHKKNKELVDV